MIENLTMTAIVLISVFAMVGVFLALLKRYKRCPSDQLLVVYGKTKGGNASEVMHGGAKFIIPIIQSYEFLSLKPMAIEIDLKGALSNQNIRVDVPASVTISISNQDGIMQNAANHLLGLSTMEIRDQASDIIFGQMRQVISNMSIEEINTDRDTFLENIQNNLTTELSKLGLKLINVNIKDIKDESGYLDALGKESAAKAINEAKVKVAEENKTGDIGSSQADQVRRSEVAEAKSKAEIGENEAIMRNRIKSSEANSKAVEGENLAQILIAESNALRQIAEAESLRRSVSSQKVQAAIAEEEALKQERVTEDSRAKKVEATLKADTIVPAQIAKERMVIDAEAEAEQIRVIAKGNADAKFADMEAEAKGINEILNKTADGFKKIVDAAGGNVQGAIQMMIADKMENLMAIQMDAIKGIEIDKITVWDNGGGKDGSGSSTTDFIQNFLKSAPQMNSIFDMVGSEFPKLLQGSGKIAENESKFKIDLKDESIDNDDDNAEII